ncbi:MAG: MbcA/ParS/Xre antitoxin family protein [Gammaproteobacteria bacterium]|nr:MbcA/ParS/Xre antitoxin family protein [Gammaproteobacteria bacterium]
MGVLQRVDTSLRKFVVAPATDRQAAAMFSAAVNLFERWGVSDTEAATLLDLPVRTYRRWKAGHIGRLGRDGKARLSNLMGIHKALRIIFAEPHRGYEWMRMSNAALDGQSALDVMLGGELTDLIRIRRYLDAESAL